MAAPSEVISKHKTKQNNSRKELLLYNVNRTTKMRHADRNIYTFASFADHLRFCSHTRLIALNEPIVPHRQMGYQTGPMWPKAFSLCLFVFVVFYVQCVNYDLLTCTFLLVFVFCFCCNPNCQIVLHKVSADVPLIRPAGYVIYANDINHDIIQD